MMCDTLIFLVKCFGKQLTIEQCSLLPIHVIAAYFPIVTITVHFIKSACV